jgi:glycosyltransferase involved in cell wall biosynthesis
VQRSKRGMPYKKILMIGPFPPVVNGVTVSNDFLYKSLLSKGNQVSIINTETGKIASMQGDKISLLKIVTFLSIYKNIFKIAGKDVIYMTIGQTFWGIAKYSPFICYCWLASIPYVFHIHGGYLSKCYLSMSRRKQRIINALITKSSCVIALSESLAADIKNVFTKAHVEVVENFYDEALIQPALERTEDSMPHFLFLSNLMLGKGILEFLEALIMLQNTHKLDFKVALAGNIEKGMREEIEKRVTQLGNKIYFFGLADFNKKKELLHWSDIFVLPTWYIMEGQPLSIIESYVTNNIVISTHQGGIKDISNYETFFKVDVKNPQMLAEIMKNTAEQLPLLTLNIHRTATLTKQRFNPEQFSGKIFNIFNKVS